MHRDVAVQDFTSYFFEIEKSELAAAVAQCANEIVTTHPELAEQYVAIRSDAIRVQALRTPSDAASKSTTP
ncbi:MAG: hypothetical protein ACREMY_26535 [bacterium]